MVTSAPTTVPSSLDRASPAGGPRERWSGGAGPTTSGPPARAGRRRGTRPGTARRARPSANGRPCERLGGDAQELGGGQVGAEDAAVGVERRGPGGEGPAATAPRGPRARPGVECSISVIPRDRLSRGPRQPHPQGSYRGFGSTGALRPLVPLPRSLAGTAARPHRVVGSPTPEHPAQAQTCRRTGAVQPRATVAAAVERARRGREPAPCAGRAIAPPRGPGSRCRVTTGRSLRRSVERPSHLGVELLDGAAHLLLGREARRGGRRARRPPCAPAGTAAARR